MPPARNPYDLGPVDGQPPQRGHVFERMDSPNQLELDRTEQLNWMKIRGIIDKVNAGGRPTREEYPLLTAYMHYDPELNKISDYGWWHTWGPIVMATAGMAGSGILAGTGALSGVGGGAPGLVPGLIDTAAANSPLAAAPVIASTVAGPSGTIDEWANEEPGKPTQTQPNDPASGAPAGTGAPSFTERLIEDLVGIGAEGLTGALASYLAPDPYQHRASYKGTSADPVSFMTGLNKNLGDVFGQAQTQLKTPARSQVDFGPAPVTPRPQYPQRAAPAASVTPTRQPFGGPNAYNMNGPQQPNKPNQQTTAAAKLLLEALTGA